MASLEELDQVIYCIIFINFLKLILGKSTLTLALFRLVEPSSGRIVLDDLNISTLGLNDLRSRLTIVPQVLHNFCFKHVYILCLL